MTAEITRLKTECAATTIHGEFVEIPRNAEAQSGWADLVAAMNNATGTTIRVMVRCPKAKMAAPYDVDVSDLWLATRR